MYISKKTEKKKKKREKENVCIIVSTSPVLLSFFFFIHLFHFILFIYFSFSVFTQTHVCIFTQPATTRNYAHCSIFYSEEDKHIAVNRLSMEKQKNIPKNIKKRTYQLASQLTASIMARKMVICLILSCFLSYDQMYVILQLNLSSLQSLCQFYVCNLSFHRFSLAQLIQS